MNKRFRLGYSFWGFTSDYKIKDGEEISTPCGNATFSYALIHELLKRNYEVWQLQPDRDFEAVELYGKDAFKAFSQEKRWNAYSKTKKYDFFEKEGLNLPELDILLVEWRFPIPGRNCLADGFIYPIENGKFDLRYQPDLFIQERLLHHYKEAGTKIILWDLDHKLTYKDEKDWCPDAIFETAFDPMHQYIHRTSVNAPCLYEDLVQFRTEKWSADKELVYIGSRYERDDVIDQYIKPYAKERHGKVHFYGNWRDYPDKLAEAEQRWPGIVFNKRITTKDFHDVYRDAVCVPLLGKRDYFRHGFTTPRPAEAIMFGSVPVAFNEHHDPQCYIPLKVKDSYELMKVVDELKNNDYYRNDRIWDQAENLFSFDARFFVDHIEDVLNK